jgi:hypothetical protein
VAAESGDRSSAQIKSMDEVGQINRRPLPRLALVDGTDAKAQANLAEPLAEPCAADVVELAAKPDDAAESLPCSSRHRTPPTP